MSKIENLQLLQSKVDDLKESILMVLIQELKKETFLDFEPRGESLDNKGAEVLRAETDLDYIYIEVGEQFFSAQITDICHPKDEKYREKIENVLERIWEF